MQPMNVGMWKLDVIPLCVLIIGIFILVANTTRRSTLGFILGLIVIFIGAFCLFDLGNLPAFRAMGLFCNSFLGAIGYHI